MVELEPPSISLLLVGKTGVGKSAVRAVFLEPGSKLEELDLGNQRSPRVLPNGSPRNAATENLAFEFKPYKVGVGGVYNVLSAGAVAVVRPERATEDV